MSCWFELDLIDLEKQFQDFHLLSQQIRQLRREEKTPDVSHDARSDGKRRPGRGARRRCPAKSGKPKQNTTAQRMDPSRTERIRGSDSRSATGAKTKPKKKSKETTHLRRGSPIRSAGVRCDGGEERSEALPRSGRRNQRILSIIINNHNHNNNNDIKRTKASYPLLLSVSFSSSPFDRWTNE